VENTDYIILKRKLQFLLICLLLIYFLCSFTSLVSAHSYQPEITGSFESGDKLYTDPGELESDESDRVDYYSYDKEWLKYRQKLAVGEYYYLKFQRQKRIYENSSTYDNLNREIQGNYTFYLTEKLKNRFVVLFRDKDYLSAAYKSYRLKRMQYTLQYKYNNFHDYQLILQKQWTDYNQSPEKDYTADRISLNWGWQLSDSFSIDSRFQIDRQLNDSHSDSTDKYGRRFSIKFKYKL
jgi:hypothetical protein